MTDDTVPETDSARNSASRLRSRIPFYEAGDKHPVED